MLNFIILGYLNNNVCLFASRFWARMPQGESRFDVCRRCGEFLGTVHRLAYEGFTDFIIVCHGMFYIIVATSTTVDVFSI